MNVFFKYIYLFIFFISPPVLALNPSTMYQSWIDLSSKKKITAAIGIPALFVGGYALLRALCKKRYLRIPEQWKIKIFLYFKKFLSSSKGSLNQGLNRSVDGQTGKEKPEDEHSIQKKDKDNQNLPNMVPLSSHNQTDSTSIKKEEEAPKVQKMIDYPWASLNPTAVNISPEDSFLVLERTPEEIAYWKQKDYCSEYAALMLLDGEDTIIEGKPWKDYKRKDREQIIREFEEEELIHLLLNYRFPDDFFLASRIDEYFSSTFITESFTEQAFKILYVCFDKIKLLKKSQLRALFDLIGLVIATAQAFNFNHLYGAQAETFLKNLTAQQEEWWNEFIADVWWRALYESKFPQSFYHSSFYPRKYVETDHKWSEFKKFVPLSSYEILPSSLIIFPRLWKYFTREEVQQMDPSYFERIPYERLAATLKSLKKCDVSSEDEEDEIEKNSVSNLTKRQIWYLYKRWHVLFEYLDLLSTHRGSRSMTSVGIEMDSAKVKRHEQLGSYFDIREPKVPLIAVNKINKQIGLPFCDENKEKNDKEDPVFAVPHVLDWFSRNQLKWWKEIKQKKVLTAEERKEIEEPIDQLKSELAKMANNDPEYEKFQENLREAEDTLFVSDAIQVEKERVRENRKKSVFTEKEVEQYTLLLSLPDGFHTKINGFPWMIYSKEEKRSLLQNIPPAAIKQITAEKEFFISSFVVPYLLPDQVKEIASSYFARIPLRKKAKEGKKHRILRAGVLDFIKQSSHLTGSQLLRIGTSHGLELGKLHENAQFLNDFSNDFIGSLEQQEIKRKGD